MVDLRINETRQTGAVGRVEPAQLETAPTKHGGRKCLSVFRIHHSFRFSPHLSQDLEIPPTEEPNTSNA